MVSLGLNKRSRFAHFGVIKVKARIKQPKNGNENTEINGHNSKDVSPTNDAVKGQ